VPAFEHRSGNVSRVPLLLLAHVED
jgi:hypothetical protein